MLIPKVNIPNVHLLENPMKSTAYPLLPPPGTLKATKYFTIILLFVAGRTNNREERILHGQSTSLACRPPSLDPSSKRTSRNRL
jgi:hypothetical protein